MDTAREILKHIIKRSPALKKRLGGVEVEENWGPVADPKGKSWVSGFNSGVLKVVTEDPSFGQELHFNKKKLIEDLNILVGEKIVKDIKIKIGTKQ